MVAAKSSFLAMALAVIACVEPSVGFAADKDEAVKKELAELEGQWDFDGAGASGPEYDNPWHRGGRKLAEVATKFDLLVLKVKGDAFAFAGTEAGKMTAKIAPTRSPKTIDLTNPKGRTWLRVYELKGDKLVITVAVGKTRPTKVVEDNVLSGQAYAVYKRAK
jgi:uncharacterized protein (TIGR03067 family)